MTYRTRWIAQRVFDLGYLRKLNEVLANPAAFYAAVALKTLPGLHRRPVPLRLKDGKVLEMRDFWGIFIFDEIFLQHDYEPEELKGLRPRTIMDVGANIGLFTLRAKQLWPDARIAAFEPEPDNFGHLKRHVDINRLADVLPFNEALSEDCTSVDLYLSPRNIGGHSLYVRTDRSVSVKARTIASALASLGGSCDLLKIDCEGCERAIVAGLTPALARQIGAIIIEPSLERKDAGAMIDRLKDLGFATVRRSNMVIARRPAA